MIHGADNRTVLVAGRLEHSHVAALLLACAQADPPIVLDLSDVLSADQTGVDALVRLRNRGVAMVGTPRYLELTLEDAG